MTSPDEIEKYKKQLEQLPADKNDMQNLYKALNMSIAKNKGTGSQRFTGKNRICIVVQHGSGAAKCL